MNHPSRSTNLASKGASSELPADGDAELMRSIGEGDLQAMGALYDRYFADIRQFIERATGSPGDAEDLAHDTFLTLPKIAHRFDGRSSARPYLLGVAAQLIRRRRRGVSRFTEILGSFAATLPLMQRRTPEQEVSEHEERTAFERALAKLSEEKRMAFLLVEREGLSGEEVARALEIPVNTVWTRLHHARADLRRSLSRGFT